MAEKATAIQVVKCWLGTKTVVSHDVWKDLAESGKLDKPYAAEIISAMEEVTKAVGSDKATAINRVERKVGHVIPGFTFHAPPGTVIPPGEPLKKKRMRSLPPEEKAKVRAAIQKAKPTKPTWDMGPLDPYKVDEVLYEPVLHDIRKTFGIKMPNGQTHVMGFKNPTDLTPPIDPDYVFDKAFTAKIIMSLTANKPMLGFGETGTGKTTHVEQVCARINYDCLRFNHHRDIIKEDIVGQLKVKEKSTYFEYGPLPWAMPRPIVYLKDEFDTITAESAFVYQPVLERKPNGRLGSLIIGTNGKKPIHSGRHFRMIAIGNTAGLGDETAMYTGTQMQNIAFVSRFQVRAKLDYLDEKAEQSILLLQFPILKGTKIVYRAVKTANNIRDRYKAGEMNVAFSVRDLINWVDFIIQLDGDVMAAIKVSMSDILPFQDAKTVEELVQRNFSSKERMPWM